MLTAPANFSPHSEEFDVLPLEHETLVLSQNKIELRTTPALCNPQFFLHLFQRHLFSFRHDGEHPNELKHHKARKHHEDVRRTKYRQQRRKKERNRCTQYPVNRTTKCLPLSTNLIRKNLADKDPNARPLPNGVGSNENHESDENDHNPRHRNR